MMEYSKDASLKEKVRWLEEAIINGTTENVVEVLEKCAPIDFMARALGLACCLGTLEKVKALVEHGVNFKYPKNLYSYTNYLHEWNNDNSAYRVSYFKNDYIKFYMFCFITSFSAPSYNHVERRYDEYELEMPKEYYTFDDSEKDDYYQVPPYVYDAYYYDQNDLEIGSLYGIDDILQTKSPASIYERSQILDYILSKKLLSSSQTSKMFLYALTHAKYGFLEFARVFDRYKVKLSSNHIDGFTSTKNTKDRIRFCSSIISFKSPNLANEYINIIRRAIESYQVEVIFSKSFFETKKYGGNVKQYNWFLNSDLFEYILKYSSNSIDFKTLFIIAICNDSSECVSVALKHRPIKSYKDCMMYIDFANRAKAALASAILLEYANKKFDLAKEEAKQTKKALKELFEDDTDWKTRTVTGGVRLISYFGPSGKVIVPDEYNGKKVLEIGNIFDDYKEVENITELEMPDVKGKWGKNLFSKLGENLKSLKIGNLVMDLSKDFNITCLKFEKGKIDVRENCFAKKNDFLGNLNCNVKQVEIPYGVTGIDNLAFHNCTELETVKIPGTVEFIGDDAFNRCFKLENIDIQNGVRYIGKYAFDSCGIQSIKLPDSIKFIGEGAFSNCEKLQNIILPTNIKEISSFTFYDCCSLKNITIPQMVETIGISAFRGCMSLENVNIPSSVESIEDCAFGWCYSLNDIYIPKNVTIISKYAIEIENYPINIESYYDPTKYVDKKYYNIEEYTDDGQSPKSIVVKNHLTIHTPVGSHAEAYAKEHHIKFVNDISTPEINLCPCEYSINELSKLLTDNKFEINQLAKVELQNLIFGNEESIPQYMKEYAAFSDAIEILPGEKYPNIRGLYFTFQRDEKHMVINTHLPFNKKLYNLMVKDARFNNIVEPDNIELMMYDGFLEIRCEIRKEIGTSECYENILSTLEYSNAILGYFNKK